MNVILFVNKDLEANLAYNLLKPALSQHNYKIYYTDSVGDNSKKPTDLKELEYYEKAFFYTDLVNFLHKNQIKHEFEFFNDDFKSAPFIKCNSVKSPDFIEEIKSFKPDLFISIRFGKIFKNNIIKIPSKGLINLHSAILPDYRGILGTLHCLKDDKKQAGITLHTIPNDGIDTGELIDIAKITTNKNKSLFWHVAQLYPKGCQLIKTAIKNIENNNLTTKKQDLATGNYYSVPTQKDFDTLKSIGFTSFSKEDYIDIIYNFILTNLNNSQKNALTNLVNNSKL